MAQDEQGVEIIGVVPSVLMVVTGLVIAITPMLVYVGILATG